MGFHYREVLPDVYHIEDSLGVCMTLLSGSRQALLVDAGYGLENVAAFAESLTDRPISLALTHAHYDHALGAGRFPEAALFAEDMELAPEHAQRMWKMRALEAARQKGIPADESAFLARRLPVLTELREGTMDLGGLSVRVIHCPGHTRGSAVFFIPERSLLLTGDNWNPCTWIFFRESLPVKEYRSNMNRLLELPFRYVLCPHSRELADRERLESFIRGLTDERLRSAVPVDTGEWLGIRTLQAEPAAGQCLVFADDRK